MTKTNETEVTNMFTAIANEYRDRLINLQNLQIDNRYFRNARRVGDTQIKYHKNLKR